MPQTVTTPAGETFSNDESKRLAQLVYKRFGKNLEASTEAWRRLFQNCTSEQQFAELIK